MIQQFLISTQQYDQTYQLDSLTIKKLPSDGMTIKYSPNDQYLAIGCKNGARLLYSLSEHKIVSRYQCMNQISVTCLKWRPSQQNKNNIVATSDAQGNINYWHIPSMKKIFNVYQKDNSILSMDFDPTGHYLASAGKDCAVRVYDQQTKTLAHTFQRAGWNKLGHDNRVFCVKFVDKNVLISGGWDSVVHIWDIREGKSVRHFYGPHISGDSIDYQNGRILIGCYSPKDQLQVWNFTSAKKIQEIDWTNNVDQAEYIYTAAYNPNTFGMFAAGSTGLHSEVRVYAEKNQTDRSHYKVMGITGINQGVFSLEFARRSNQIAFTTAHQGFYIYDYRKDGSDDEA